MPDYAEIEELIRRREQARTQKDFARADAIRAELKKQGITLLDAAECWIYQHGLRHMGEIELARGLVGLGGAALSQRRAFARYLLSWLWFLPALATLYLAGIHSLGAIFGVMLAGVAGYALLSRLHPQRQFWHDAVCGTRVVAAPPR